MNDRQILVDIQRNTGFFELWMTLTENAENIETSSNHNSSKELSATSTRRLDTLTRALDTIATTPMSIESSGESSRLQL